MCFFDFHNFNFTAPLRISNVSPSLNILKFSDSGPTINLKFFFIVKGFAASETLRDIFKSLLMSYFIMKQIKNKYCIVGTRVNLYTALHYSQKLFAYFSDSDPYYYY